MEAVAAQRPSGPGAESQEEDGGPMGGWLESDPENGCHFWLVCGGFSSAVSVISCYLLHLLLMKLMISPFIVD